MSRIKFVTGERIPSRVLIGVLMRPTGPGSFRVFKKGFLQVALFKKGSESRAKRFFSRGQVKSSRKRARVPLLLMM